jgi:hypothetical protein
MAKRLFRMAIKILAVKEGDCPFDLWLFHVNAQTITPPGPFGVSGGELVRLQSYTTLYILSMPVSLNPSQSSN